jgi:hypothetical protein
VRGVEQESDRLVIARDLITTNELGETVADGKQYFLGYNDPEAHKESDHWIKQAHERLQAEKEKRLAGQPGQAALRVVS